MFEIVEADDRVTLVVRGALTIQQALGFKEALADWIEKSDTLSLHFDGLDEADLTGLQLICSTHRSLLDRKKSLILEAGLPETLIKEAQEAGFTGTGRCPVIDRKACLWIQRDEK
jgi:anti-anti-sigma regulatory factor